MIFNLFKKTAVLTLKDKAGRPGAAQPNKAKKTKKFKEAEIEKKAAKPKKIKKPKRPKKIKKIAPRVKPKVKPAKKRLVKGGGLMPEDTEIVGRVTHYFPHVNAAVIKLEAALSAGETIHIKGHSTDFKQLISSMQIDNNPVESAKKGDEIGLLVKERVRIHDIVYRA